MPTKPTAVFPPDMVEALASFRLDVPGTATPGKKRHAQKPRDLVAPPRPKQQSTLAYKACCSVDLAVKHWTELQAILDETAALPDCLDLAVVERVAFDLATVRSQIAAWMFEAGAPRKHPSRAYVDAVRAALAEGRELP